MRIIKRPTSKSQTSTAKSTSDEDVALLAKYRRRPTVKSRNQLVERFRRVVEEMARGLRARLPRSVDVQDLTHAGLWGLIQAIENYRAELGHSFIPFMRIRVRGAMLDELRNMDYLPRLYRSRLRLREAAVHRLRHTLSRDPSDAEVAEDLGVSESRLRLLFSLRSPILGGQLRSTDPERDEFTEHDLLGSLADASQEAPIEAIHRRELIEKIESSLQPIEWDVLRLHYLEGLTGKDVARRLHLSASRICQIHGRVLSRLKTKLSSTAS